MSYLSCHNTECIIEIYKWQLGFALHGTGRQQIRRTCGITLEESLRTGNKRGGVTGQTRGGVDTKARAGLSK